MNLNLFGIIPSIIIIKINLMEYISLGSNCSVTYQLNKLGLRTNGYPFDWAKVSLIQLINVLSNNFDDFSESIEFKKKSLSHKIIEYNNGESNDSCSILVSNKYGIIFAHELASKYEIDEFKSKINMRIERFCDLSTNPIQIPIPNRFIRIELNPIKSNWVSQIYQLVDLLDKIVLSYELILVINSSTQYKFPPNVKIFQFNNFSSDWKMDELDWENIFI